MKVVLVPLDGSSFSRRALPVPAWMAERLGGGLSLVSAINSEDERAARSESATARPTVCSGPTAT